MKKIELTKGKYALVDDEDFDFLNQWKWHWHDDRGGGYAERACRESGKSKHIKMHRLLLKIPSGFEPDHIDGNGLNNQKLNLRIATASQNQINRGKQKNNTSGFKGVYLRRDRKKRWRAQIKFHRIIKHIGYFSSKEEAALAYNKAAVEYFGEFAKLNVI